MLLKKVASLQAGLWLLGETQFESLQPFLHLPQFKSESHVGITRSLSEATPMGGAVTNGTSYTAQRLQ